MRTHTEIWNEVQAKYACTHKITELRNKPDKNNRPRVSQQCLNCGRQVGNFQPSKTISPAQLNALGLWNSDLENNYWRRASSEVDRLSQEEKDKETDEWWKAYDAHLQSPKWQGLRKKVFARAQNICEGCGLNRPTQAHHLTYDRVGDEMLFDLVAVCNDCHSKIHHKRTCSDEDIPDKDNVDNFPSGDENSPF